MSAKAGELFKRYVILAYGVAIQATGCALLYYSNLGSGAVAMFNQGLSSTLDISVGVANYIGGAVFLVIAFILDRSKITLGTVLLTFGFGTFLDVVMRMLDVVWMDNMTEVQAYIAMVVGAILLAAGIGIIISAEAGIGSVEAVYVIICEKCHISFKLMRIMGDGVFFIFALLLGGVFGIATIISTVFGGYITVYTVKLGNATYLKKLGLEASSLK